MVIPNKLIAKPYHFFKYLFLLLLFILVKTEERILPKIQFFNEITLKMKGPISSFGFFTNNSDGHCFKGQIPSEIILNGHDYINNNTKITQLENDICTILLKWEDKMVNFSKMFYGCENILEVDLTRINFSYVNSFEYMFSNCKSLTSVKFFDLT